MKRGVVESSAGAVITALLAFFAAGAPTFASGVSLPPELEQLSALFERCTWAPAALMGPPRDTVIDVAGKYLEALVSHDASEVPLAPDVCRMENGLNSGRSAEDVRRGIETPALGGIQGIRDVRWYVEGDQGIAFYILETTGSTVYVAERFRVAGGLIHEIEADFSATGRPPIPGLSD